MAPGGTGPDRRRAIAALAGAAFTGGAITWPLDGARQPPLAPVTGDPSLWTADAEFTDAEFFGPVTAGGLLLVEEPLTARERTRVLSCLDPVTGNRRWSVPLRPSLGELKKMLVAGSTMLVRTEETLLALDPRTGHTIWNRDRKTNESFSTVLTGAGLVLDSGANRPEAERNPAYTTHAYEIGSGRLRWTTEVKPAVWAQSSSIHAAGLLVGAASAPDPRALLGEDLLISYAMDAATGRQRWWRRLSEDEWASKMTLAYARGTVFVSLNGRDLVAQDAATGTIRWRSRFNARANTGAERGGGPDRGGPDRDARRPPVGADVPVPAGDTVYLCGADGVLRAFDLRDGRRRWEFTLGEGPSARRDVPSSPRPIIANGLVYVTAVGTSVTSDETTIHVLDAADGRRRWSRPAYNSHGGPVMVRGSLFVPDGKSVVGYDPSDGTVRLRLDLEALNLHERSIELATDGVRLFVLARDQVLALSLAG
ncbi:PQQ-like beta-propeller repeat protein [Spirillospora sp. NBC_00431]